MWISVKERLPEIGDVVNIVTTDPAGNAESTSAVRLLPYEDSPRYFWKGGTYWQMILPEHVTHWQPLPPPPDERSGQEPDKKTT